MAIKVSIDKKKCIACGTCASLADTVFSYDEEGYMQVLKNTVTDEAEIEAVRDASKNCPQEAIEIREI